MFKYIGIFLLTLLLVSCAGKPDFDVRIADVAYKDLEKVEQLEGDPIVIAVYDFVDLTGQKKPGGDFASMSTAVTQGSYQLLIKALQDAGDGKWFRVVERASLPSLLQERKLIRSTRQQVDGEGAEPLPALLFAGAYITGGIVGYDSDIKSGGVGARILGIQNHAQYRQDVVTIILRWVNVQSGEVVITTTIEKTIFSTSRGADIFKYFDADTMLLEVEAGVARNEPVTFAVRKAIEKGVVELIKEGVDKGLWRYKELAIEEIAVEDKPVVEMNAIELNIHDTGPKKEKTYEEFLEEKKLKQENEIADEKLKEEANEAEWNQIDTDEKEEQDEKTDNDSSDSGNPNN